MSRMHVTTNDGKVYEGVTPQAIVRQMRDTQWNAPERKRQWMDEVTDRLMQSHGVAIPFGVSAGEFLDRLEGAGIVVIVRTA